MISIYMKATEHGRRRQAALIVGNYVEPNISYFPDTNLSDPVRVTLSGTTTVNAIIPLHAMQS